MGWQSGVCYNTAIAHIALVDLCMEHGLRLTGSNEGSNGRLEDIGNSVEGNAASAAVGYPG